MRFLFALTFLLPVAAFGQSDSAQSPEPLGMEQTYTLPFKAHFESGPYQLFSPNTSANNSITGNLSGLQLSMRIHRHFSVGLSVQDAQSQALTESGELLYLDQMRWAGFLASGFLIGVDEYSPWDLSASLGWGYARSSFTETPGVPLVYHQTGYPWVFRVQGHYRNRDSPFLFKHCIILPVEIAFGPQTTLDMRTDKLRTTWLWSLSWPLMGGFLSGGC